MHDEKRVYKLLTTVNPLIHKSTKKSVEKVINKSLTGYATAYSQSYTLGIFDLRYQFFDRISQLRVGNSFAGNFVMCMNNGGVVAPAKHFSDPRQ